MATPLKTARMTVLIDPESKASFLQRCRALDVTPSQVVRRCIREFLSERPQAPPPPARKRR